jgi:outer membrane biosynthesis protein TonB
MRKRNLVQSGTTALYQFAIGQTVKQIIDSNGDIYVCVGNDPLLAAAAATETATEANAKAEVKPQPAKEEPKPSKKEAAVAKKQVESVAEVGEDYDTIVKFFADYEDDDTDFDSDALEAAIKDLGYNVRAFMPVLESWLDNELTSEVAATKISQLEKKAVPSNKKAKPEPATEPKVEKPAAKGKKKEPVEEPEEEPEDDAEEIVFVRMQDFDMEEGQIVYLSDVQNPGDNDDVELVTVKSVSDDSYTCSVTSPEGKVKKEVATLSRIEGEDTFYAFIALAS